MKTTLPLISIVTVSFEAREDIKRWLKWALDETYPHKEILVFENGSGSDVLSELKKYEDLVKVIYHTQNIGKTPALNRVFSHCKGEAIFILDQDATMQNGALESLVVDLFAEERVGAIGPIVCHAEDPDHIWAAGTSVNMWNGRNTFYGYGLSYNAYSKESPRKAVSILPTAALIRSSVWREIGGNDEDIFLVYCDSTLCHRILDKGYSIFCLHSARAYHFEPKGIGSLEKHGVNTKMRAFLVARNRALFIMRHGTVTQKIVYFLVFHPLYAIYYSFYFATQKRWDLLGAYWKGMLSSILTHLNIERPIYDIIPLL